jgi:sugar lactone lactonase YvrE
MLHQHGRVSTYVGNGHTGSHDGYRLQAGLTDPMGLDFDAGGNLYIADWGSQSIKRVSADGWVRTVAGTAGQYGMKDGSGSAALFFAPMGVSIDRKRHVAYVTDTDNARIRKIELPLP